MNPDPNSHGQRYVPALTGLRFFAAGLIVLTHSCGYFLPVGVFGPFTPAGAVPLFFVLSGFVLTLNRGKYGSAADFLAARIGRIWPAHLAAAAFLVAIFWPDSLSLLHGAANLERLSMNVLLLQAWSPSIATYWSLNSPSWSVSCELLFYVTFPWCVGWAGRGAAWRLIALFTGSAFTVLLLARSFPALDANWLGDVNPPVNLPVFFLGIAAARLFMNAAPAAVGYRKATIIQSLAVAAALGGNMIFAVFDTADLPQAFLIWLHQSGPAPLYAALLLALARYDGAISRFLSRRAVVYLGEISYSIYLFHQPIIRWYSVHLSWFAALPLWGRFGVIWVAIIVTAAISFHLVEGPGRRAIRAVWTAVRVKPRQLTRPARG